MHRCSSCLFINFKQLALGRCYFYRYSFAYPIYCLPQCHYLALNLLRCLWVLLRLLLSIVCSRIIGRIVHGGIHSKLCQRVHSISHPFIQCMVHALAPKPLFLHVVVHGLCYIAPYGNPITCHDTENTI